uniref:Uncharacterized protein n=1 Tax=Arundo donax TaxID=35708 RepID=A0A0A9H3R1_ARUDO
MGFIEFAIAYLVKKYMIYMDQSHG